jgi:hypothetical protein
MADARNRAEWGRAASIMALIANVNRDPKKSRAFKPGDFDPFSQRRSGEAPKLKMSEVKGMLGGMVRQRNQKSHAARPTRIRPGTQAQAERLDGEDAGPDLPERDPGLEPPSPRLDQ